MSNFTGFASGGRKALWLSHEFSGDNRLVLCESAIDALSHAVLFPDNRTRYASIGGKPNPQQPELIRAAIRRMPKYAKIIAAMDADEDGAKLADVVRKAVALTGRLDLKFTVQEPFGFKDWNDQLRKRPQQDRPSVSDGRLLLNGVDVAVGVSAGGSRIERSIELKVFPLAEADECRHGILDLVIQLGVVLIASVSHRHILFQIVAHKPGRRRRRQPGQPRGGERV